MKEILTHNFTAVYFVIGLFASLFLYNVVNIGYWTKRVFKIRITKEVKILDCMPCFNFWLTLAITQSILCAMLVWSIVFLNDKTK